MLQYPAIPYCNNDVECNGTSQLHEVSRRFSDSQLAMYCILQKGSLLCNIRHAHAYRKKHLHFKNVARQLLLHAVASTSWPHHFYLSPMALRQLMRRWNLTWIEKVYTHSLETHEIWVQVQRYGRESKYVLSVVQHTLIIGIWQMWIDIYRGT